MADEDIQERLGERVDEEKSLRQSEQRDRDRLAHLAEALNQCWNLLRPRQALREFGHDPRAPATRSVETVEHYLQ